MCAKLLTSGLSNRLFVLNLCPQPHTEFQNPLKLLGVIMPPVIVADRVRRKVIVHRVRSAGAVRYHMVRLPIAVVDRSATDVASTVGFAQHLASLGSRQRRSSNPSVATCVHAFTPLCPQFAQFGGKRSYIRKNFVCWHIKVPL
jgi:hypothetical protein